MCSLCHVVSRCLLAQYHGDLSALHHPTSSVSGISLNPNQPLTPPPPLARLLVRSPSHLPDMFKAPNIYAVLFTIFVSFCSVTISPSVMQVSSKLLSIRSQRLSRSPPIFFIAIVYSPIQSISLLLVLCIHCLRPSRCISSFLRFRYDGGYIGRLTSARSS